MYLPKPTKLIDGVPYVAVDGILTQLGANIIEEDTVWVTFEIKNKVYKVTTDTTEYIANGKTATLSAPSVLYNDVVYVPFKDFASVLGVNMSYNDALKLLTIR